MNRLRVTMLGSLPPIKGISDYCLEQTRELARLIDVDFINFSKIYPESMYPGGQTTEDDPLFTVQHSPNLEVYRLLSFCNPFSWFRAACKVKGDILHVHWWSVVLGPVFLPTLLSARLRRKPVVTTVHNVVSHEKNWLDSVVNRVIFALSDHFIVHTEQNKEQLESFFGIDSGSISVIPYGVYTFYCDVEVDLEQARKALGLRCSDKVILNMGNIRPYKGIGTLLYAFSIVSKRLPDARLVIAGEPWVDWSEWDVLIDKLDIRDKVVLHLKYIPSSAVKLYFTAADIVVVPYEHFHAQSGTGNVALGFGKPLIVTDVGGLPALVRDPRLVVPAGDAEALGVALIDLLENESRLSEAGQDSRMLASHHSWENVAEQTVKVYHRLVPEIIERNPV